MLMVGTTVSAQGDAISAKLEKPKVLAQFNGVGHDNYKLEQVKNISVSSNSQHADGKYHPSNLIDNNNATAWVANLKHLDYPQKDAKGTAAYFSFSDGDEPLLIEIVPGYAKNEKTWKENATIKKVRITYLNENKDMNAPIMDQIVMLDNKSPMKSQYVSFMSDYVHNMAMTEFSFIRVEILDTKAGDKYQDACISTINFYKKGSQIK